MNPDTEKVSTLEEIKALPIGSIISISVGKVTSAILKVDEDDWAIAGQPQHNTNEYIFSALKALSSEYAQSATVVRKGM